MAGFTIAAGCVVGSFAAGVILSEKVKAGLVSLKDKILAKLPFGH